MSPEQLSKCRTVAVAPGVVELLSRASIAGVLILPDGPNLRCIARRCWPPGLREEIAALKPGLLALLATEPTPAYSEPVPAWLDDPSLAVSIAEVEEAVSRSSTSASVRRSRDRRSAIPCPGAPDLLPKE